MRRIQFFSIHDGASGYYLGELENRFSEINMKDKLEINDLLELYNAKLYLDHDMYLRSWDEQKRKELTNKMGPFWEEIKSFFIKINSETISILFAQVEFQYRGHFWDIIDQLQIYKNVSDEALKNLLETHHHEIRNILQKERLVKGFSATIRNYLLTHPKSAELILADEDHSERKSKLFFPKSLSNSDKEKIINDYLDLEDPNLNYISLAEYVKDSNHLMLSDKTRLKAKQRYNKLSGDFLTNNLSATKIYGIEVGTDEDQEPPVIYTAKDDATQKVTYNYNFLNVLLDTEELTLLFKGLYRFLDGQGLVTLVSKNSEINTLEKIFMHSKNEYHIGLKFRRKNLLSLSQIALTNRLLQKKSKNLSNHINKHLVKISVFDEELKKFRFTIPSDFLSDEEKIKILAPALESFLSQYQLYIADGEIDFELLGISSKPINFSSVGSKVKTKYVYPNLNTRLGELLHIFFSDQSLLYYIEPYRDKYNNFYSLLINEDNVRYDNLESYQKAVIDTLVSEDYLFLDNKRFLKIKNKIQLFIISKFYENDVISYWYFPPTIRKEMDAMAKNELCYTESTLFTKHEVAYFNYYLNKKQFTDGPDLRNKYLHGTNIPSDNNNLDYLMFLRIAILCLLKIEDDLMLYQKLVI